MDATRFNLILRPGATFGPYVFTATDLIGIPIDLTGWIPYAEYREIPESIVKLDLQPILLSSGSVGAVTADPVTNLVSLISHGLIAGQCIYFENVGGVLPSPLLIDSPYYVSAVGLTPDEFMVSDSPVGAMIAIASAGSGTTTVFSLQGQVALPEITDEDTHDMAESSGGWDLMLEDPLGRRYAPFVVGTFQIKDGYTNPDEPAGSVLKADGTSADAYITQDWGSDESEVWVSFGLAFHADALTLWNATPSGEFIGVHTVTDSLCVELSIDPVDHPGTPWILDGSTLGAGSTPAPTAEVWQNCEIHYTAGGACEFYIGGVLVASYTDGVSSLARAIQIGQVPANVDPADIAYFKNVKVGTTRHGTDLISEDFSGGLGAWIVTGACSTESDPF